MGQAYLIAGARTPIARFLGAFRDLPAPDLGAAVVASSLQRGNVDPSEVDEVIMGNVLSAGTGQAPARQAALRAGLPETVAAVTINKVCGSGLKAAMLADQAIRAGDARIIVAGGMENMTRAPRLLQGSRSGCKLGDVPLEDSLLQDGLWCAFEHCHMGVHAESTARECDVSREEQDAFALRSHQRAVEAWSKGAFDAEVVPIGIGNKEVERDEGPRPETDAGALASLKPVFDAEGTVTAGNSSMISDGAAALIVADREVAARSDRTWCARIVATATAGVAPKDLFVAPVAAVRDVVSKARLSLANVDLFEINEAFASQSIACIRQLGLDDEKVNVCGGAIALGHPIGASGARVLVTLLAALHRRDLQFGVASLCLGGGNAVAMLIERTQPTA